MSSLKIMEKKKEKKKEHEISPITISYGAEELRYIPETAETKQAQQQPQPAIQQAQAIQQMRTPTPQPAETMQRAPPQPEKSSEEKTEKKEEEKKQSTGLNLQEFRGKRFSVVREGDGWRIYINIVGMGGNTGITAMDAVVAVDIALLISYVVDFIKRDQVEPLLKWNLSDLERFVNTWWQAYANIGGAFDFLLNTTLTGYKEFLDEAEEYLKIINFDPNDKTLLFYLKAYGGIDPSSKEAQEKWFRLLDKIKETRELVKKAYDHISELVKQYKQKYRL